MGGLDRLEQEFRVSPGAAGTPISVTLRPDGGTVQGLVAHSDGQPAKEAYLTLAPEDTAPLRDHLFHRTQADSNGRFPITGVAPGNYRLYAWESRDGVVDSDPDFLAQFASRSVTIQVRAAVVTEQQAVLIPADSPGL